MHELFIGMSISDFKNNPSFCVSPDYIVLGRKLGNCMIFNGIRLFSRNEDFGKTHQKSHFLLILAI
jgi:hypothetical protein